MMYRIYRCLFLLTACLALGFVGDLLAPGATVYAQAPSAPVVKATTPLGIVTADGKKHPFKVEVVAEPEERAVGLMFRRSLAADGGMLFDFGRTEPVAMWMKNTLIPLDMLFIASDGSIVNIAQRTVPGSLATIPSAKPVRFVLEVAGGTVSRLGIKPGDKVIHPLFGNAGH